MKQKRYFLFSFFFFFIIATFVTVFTVNAIEERFVQHPLEWELVEGDRHFFEQLSFEGYGLGNGSRSYLFQKERDSIELSPIRRSLDGHMSYSAQAEHILHEDRRFFRLPPMERNLVLESEDYLIAVGSKESYDDGYKQFLTIHSKEKQGVQKEPLSIPIDQHYFSNLDGIIQGDRLLLLAGDYTYLEQEGFLNAYEIDLGTNTVVHSDTIVGPQFIEGLGTEFDDFQYAHEPHTVTFHPDQPVAIYIHERSDGKMGYSIYHFQSQKLYTLETSQTYQDTLIAPSPDGFHLLEKRNTKGHLLTVTLNDDGIVSEELLELDLPALRLTSSFAYHNNQLALLRQEDGSEYQLELFHVSDNNPLLSAKLPIKKEHGIVQITSMQFEE
ncbi:MULTISPECIES: hypothetical protein [Shouchella]|uniref:Uncharacterized protein n=2 Tax=Shouchella TaxID=2893057 RepID=A0ABY7W9K6_9BACI|nr:MULTISPECIES: hypothetical protein [Shouchella]MED4130222.1 hypothetical protein [Shouchella miscanthi]WDF04482.1 hypothetical protein PQ477_03120 [Shouchella hunanensis]GAF23751.1 hypothetical protein JCM19047_3594 [Bacillus sp. JCM 19047]